MKLTDHFGADVVVVNAREVLFEVFRDLTGVQLHSQERLAEVGAFGHIARPFELRSLRLFATVDLQILQCERLNRFLQLEFFIKKFLPRPY